MIRKLLICGFLLTCAPAYGEVAPEEAVKAAFIYHFISFTEWTGATPDVYYVCVPYDNSLRETARETLSGKRVNDREIQVVRWADTCHVLVSDAAARSNEATLTIGHLDRGALLEFRVVDNKLRFAVNMNTVKKSKLKISSQLLKLAILDEGV
jgi:hypothetical protein